VGARAIEKEREREWERDNDVSHPLPLAVNAGPTESPNSQWQFRSLNGMLAKRSVAVANEACALSNRASLLRFFRIVKPWSDKDDLAMRTVQCSDRNVEPSSEGTTRLDARALSSMMMILVQLSGCRYRADRLARLRMYEPSIQAPVADIQSQNTRCLHCCERAFPHWSFLFNTQYMYIATKRKDRWAKESVYHITGNKS
jgi:hypothetical protein